MERPDLIHLVAFVIYPPFSFSNSIILYNSIGLINKGELINSAFLFVRESAVINMKSADVSGLAFTANSHPSISGIFISQRIKLNARSCNFRKPSLPLFAICGKYPDRLSPIASDSAEPGSSSTIKIFFSVCFIIISSSINSESSQRICHLRHA